LTAGQQVITGCDPEFFFSCLVIYLVRYNIFNRKVPEGIIAIPFTELRTVDNINICRLFEDMFVGFVYLLEHDKDLSYKSGSRFDMMRPS
jgi:hypothetical protein